MKAQVAIEFLIIAMLAIFILAGLLVTLLHTQQDISSQTSNQALSNIADQLQQELLLATQVRDGYTRTFELPASAANQPYTINQSNTTFTLHISQYTQTRRVPPFNGTITPPTITVTKRQGVISVS